MTQEKEGAVLIFDLNFKLINKTDGLISFLKQFQNSEINQEEFLGKVKFETTADIFTQNKQFKGMEEAVQKELDGMLIEIKLEICKRLRVMLAFTQLSKNITEDWQKIKVFNSILIDLKQQGLFDMIKEFMQENNIDIGKRFAFEEKYKPFTPKLNGKESKNHIKSILKSDSDKIDSSYTIWLNSLEYEKASKSASASMPKIPAKSLPEDIIYEKIIPKIIDGNSFRFNTKKDEIFSFREIFDLSNYTLKITAE